MKKLILLVEDDPTDEKLTLLALRKCGVEHEVVVAHDGAEALELLAADSGARDASATPSLILLDLKLPRVAGLDVIRRVREDERVMHVPIVVLTASREPEDLNHSYAYGANAYVRKPVDFARMVAAANIICEFWLGLNEMAPGGRGS
jgi:two-component system response regulator